ncbi:hypothetical protein GFL54_31950 [Rhizobium laguerreae]|nr:hypothetical protein [Rhizobium laguerreae]
MRGPPKPVFPYNVYAGFDRIVLRRRRQVVTRGVCRVAPSTACRHLLPEGRREIAATSPFLAHFSQGTFPLPVFTGVRRAARPRQG